MLFQGHKVCVDKNTGVSLPDYKKVATAFGFPYYTEEQMEDFINNPGYGIMEIFMDAEQEFIPKVRGMKQQDGTIKSGLLEEMSPLLPLSKIEEAMITKINERSKQTVR